jgi:hypothetical protein
MDYRKLYIELIVEFCNQDEAKAETVVDEALRRRELKKQEMRDESMPKMQRLYLV